MTCWAELASMLWSEKLIVALLNSSSYSRVNKERLLPRGPRYESTLSSSLSSDPLEESKLIRKLSTC